MKESALSSIDDFNAQEERVYQIYEDLLKANPYINPPELTLGEIKDFPETRGLAACYIITHDIFIDYCYSSEASDAEIAGCLAHELAHALAGIHKGHGPDFRRWESEIIDRCRCYGMVVKRAPDQQRVRAEL